MDLGAASKFLLTSKPDLTQTPLENLRLELNQLFIDMTLKLPLKENLVAKALKSC